jgi:hypothetical protein
VSSTIQLLKEKKVVQWALGYLAAAFVALQLMDALEAPLALTPHTQLSVVVLLATGLVITVIVAWFHGDKGHQRIKPAEVVTVGITLVAGISLAAVPWGAAHSPSTHGPQVESGSGSILSQSESGSDATSVAGDLEELTASATMPTAGGLEDPSTAAPDSGGPESTQERNRQADIDRTPPPTITPETPTIFVGDSVRLELDPDGLALWTSSDRSVALVMSDGLVLGVGPGTTQISAAVEGTEVSIRLSVHAVSVSEIVITPVDTMRIGESTRPSVEVHLANGRTRRRAELEWSSSDSSVVRIGPRGTLLAVTSGSAWVTARVDGVVGSIEVIVEDRPEAVVPHRPVSADVLFPVLELYRAALQSQNMDEVVAVYPGISFEERAGWETLFGLGGLTVEFSGLNVREASSTTAEVEFDQTLAGERIEQNITRFIATLASDDEGWRIQNLRTIGSSP